LKEHGACTGLRVLNLQPLHKKNVTIMYMYALPGLPCSIFFQDKYANEVEVTTKQKLAESTLDMLSNLSINQTVFSKVINSLD